MRNPYLDLLNLIQLELLSHRELLPESEPVEAIDHVLRLNVQAIASGLRNTG